MERRDLLKLLGASVGGVSLAACARDTTAPPDPLGGALPALPGGFAFYPLQVSGVSLTDGGTLDHFRLDCSSTDQDGAFCSGVESSGREAIYFVQVDYSTRVPGTLGASKLLRAGDQLGGRTVVGVHNYDCNKNGDLGVIVSFADESAATGGPPVTKEVWLHRWGGGWTRMLHDGFVTHEGHVLTGLIDDIDVHTDCDMLVTAWYHNRSDIAATRARLQDPNFPDDTKTQQAVFSITGGDPTTTTVELRDDQLQATDAGVSAIGLIDMHDGGHFAVQAFPGRLRTGLGAGASATASPDHPFLVQGRVGSGGRGAVPLTAPAGGSANPLFSLLDGPSGDAFYGPRVGPNGLVAYLLLQWPLGPALYLGSQRVVGVGDCIPGFGACNAGDYGIAAVNPPTFGNRGEVYFVAECPNGAFLCASNGYATRSYYPRVTFPQFQTLATSVALGHLTDSVDSEGRIYLFTMLDDGSVALSVAIPN